MSEGITGGTGAAEYYAREFRQQPDYLLRIIAQHGAPEAKAIALEVLNERIAEFRKTFSKKRGRPKLLSGKAATIVEEMSARYLTERSKQNNYYYMLALAALPLDDPRYAWLQSSHNVRRTILAELGRLEDGDAIRNFALQICEARMTTRSALRALREVRGVRMAPKRSGAANAIITALNNYLRQHPDTTNEQLIEAVRVVLGTLEARKK